MKFGAEMFGRKNNPIEIEDQNVPTKILEQNEDIDTSRRSFMRGGAAVAASYVIGEAAEAAEVKDKFAGEVEYKGFRPSKHEELLIRSNLKALVPEALSVQITLNPPDSSFGKDVATQNMKMNIIFSNGKELNVIGVAAFYQEKVDINAEMLSKLFTRLRQSLEAKK